MIKVSVIIPVYNAERYLSMALESILKQTLTDIEVICVDDGSTDHSLQILEKYQQTDQRIVLLRQKNSYAGAARNYGMSAARGKYLVFLDSDDYFASVMLEKAYLNAEQQNADMVIYGGEYFVHCLENAYPAPDFLEESLIPEGNGFDNQEKLEGIMNITTSTLWNKMFRREFIEEKKLRFQPCKRANDLFFVELALVLAERIGIVRENLVFYRTRNAESLQGTRNEQPDYFVKPLLDIRNYLQECGLYPNVEKSFRNLCLLHCVCNLAGILDFKAYESLYHVLKSCVFKEFHILGSPREDYYNQSFYEEYLNVMKYSAFENWTERYKGQLANDVMCQYLFPFKRVPENSHILMYGGGKVGRAFYRQIKKTRYCVLEAWLDNRVKEYDTYPLLSPGQTDWKNCDCIVIAIQNETIAKEIMTDVHKNYGVPYEKMIWENPLC